MPGARAGAPTMTHDTFLDATLPHLDAVWSVARRMSSDAGAAEDLVQETYARAWRSFASQGRGEVRSWLVAICLNAARSELRRSLRRPREVVGLDHLGDVVDRVGGPGTDVDLEALASVERAVLAEALRALPEPQRRAVVLVDIGGLTAQEAAHLEGAPRGTILARVHRGRRRLAALLRSEGSARGA